MLEELITRALGGEEQVRRIADLPDLPKKLQPDALRELARYLLDKERE